MEYVKIVYINNLEENIFLHVYLEKDIFILLNQKMKWILFLMNKYGLEIKKNEN